MPIKKENILRQFFSDCCTYQNRNQNLANRPTLLHYSMYLVIFVSGFALSPSIYKPNLLDYNSKFTSVELRKLYDKLKTQRSLEAQRNKGVTGLMLTPAIFSTLPAGMRLEWAQRKIKKEIQTGC